MAVSAKRQLQFWGIAFAVFVLVLWLLGSTLLPFLLGAGLAYFLDPLADRLERLGLNRVAATSVIAVVAVVAFGVALLFGVPALIGQIEALVAALPDYIAGLIDLLSRRYPDIFGESSPFRRNLSDVETMLRDGGLTVATGVLAGALGVLDFLVLLFVTPVVAFYLLLDWDRMVTKVNGILPRQHGPTIRRLARDIDVVLAGFVRGQLSVCLILGGFYAIALMAIGLQYGFLVGIIAGLVSFVPYVGSTFGLVLSLGIAAFQFWDAKLWIVLTAGIFFFGQFVEGNILSPNLIGKSVGLHPVWLILALAVFGTLFGFTGLLVAVPVAAALGVISRFLIERYLESPLYTGRCRPRTTKPCGRGSSSSTCRRARRTAATPSSSRRRTSSPSRQVDSWPGWPLGRLAVAGPRGSGKTHLAHVWAARAAARVLAAADLAALDLGRLPGDAALVVEDVDRSGGDAAVEEALFHLCNRLAAGGGSLLVTGREPPARWPLALPDLASRLRAAPVARLEPPTTRCSPRCWSSSSPTASSPSAPSSSTISSPGWTARSPPPRRWSRPSTAPASPVTARSPPGSPARCSAARSLLIVMMRATPQRPGGERGGRGSCRSRHAGPQARLAHRGRRGAAPKER